ncbi:MAG: NlpC/P60 family protein [Pseudomonadota bacterium]
MTQSFSTPERAVAEARRWLGTPYVHQASALGAGCDCLGLVRGVWRALYGVEPTRVPAYSPYWQEERLDDPLMKAGFEFFEPLDLSALHPGSVLVFQMHSGSACKHLGVFAGQGDRPSFIHSLSRRGVVESALTQSWRRRIAAQFAFPK